MSDITREDAVKWLTNLRDDCGRYQDIWHYGEALEQIIKLLDTDVAPVKHGYWQITDAYPHNVYCSECHTKYAQTHWGVWEDGSLPRRFCPNCGSIMDGDNNEIN